MKISKSPSKKSKIIISLIIVILLIVGGLAWWYATRLPSGKDSTTPQSGINYGKPTNNQKNAGDQTKSNAQKNNETSGSDQPPAPTPVSGTNKQQVATTITATQQSGQQYLVRAMVGTISSNGTCTLTMQKSGQPTVNMSAGVQPQASTSVCKGFNIPLSSLSPGTWQLAINFSDGNLIGSATKSVIIQ